MRERESLRSHSYQAIAKSKSRLYFRIIGICMQSIISFVFFSPTALHSVRFPLGSFQSFFCRTRTFTTENSTCCQTRNSINNWSSSFSALRVRSKHVFFFIMPYKCCIYSTRVWFLIDCKNKEFTEPFVCVYQYHFPFLTVAHQLALHDHELHRFLGRTDAPLVDQRRTDPECLIDFLICLFSLSAPSVKDREMASTSLFPLHTTFAFLYPRESVAVAR